MFTFGIYFGGEEAIYGVITVSTGLTLNPVAMFNLLSC